MSLILEALRKSEEQRRLGRAPDLISEASWAGRRRYLDSPRRPWLPWAIGLAALALAGAGGWWVYSRDARETAAEDEAASAARDAAALAAARAAQTPAGSHATDALQSATPTPPPLTQLAQPTPALADPPALAGAEDALMQPPRVPTGPDDNGLARLDAATRERFQRGEVFANSPDLLVPKPPTSETPYVPPEAALPQPLPEEPVPGAATPAPASSVAGADAPPVLPTMQPSTADTGAVATPSAPVAAAAATATPPTPAVAAAPTPAAPLPIGQNPAVPGYEPSPPNLFELPFDVRHDLPPLKVMMHVWSAQPAERFVVIDEVRAGEGQSLAEGLDVIEIRNDGVVLAFRGQRFVLPRTGR